MKISLIYAQNQQGVIGYRGTHPLPWHYPEDLTRFKELTLNKPIIMGMDTFNSLSQPLPKRFNYVVTSKRGLVSLGRLDNVQFVLSTQLAIKMAESHGEEEVFIIGGAGLINGAIDSSMADTIYRTVVKSEELVGDLARVLKPEDLDPVWDNYQLTDETKVSDDLLFQTYEKRKG